MGVRRRANLNDALSLFGIAHLCLQVLNGDGFGAFACKCQTHCSPDSTVTASHQTNLEKANQVSSLTAKAMSRMCYFVFQFARTLQAKALASSRAVTGKTTHLVRGLSETGPSLHLDTTTQSREHFYIGSLPQAKLTCTSRPGAA